MSFIPMIKAVFSASLLRSSVSHDSSEIILICLFDDQETFINIINNENSCATFLIRKFNRKYIFCNINVFTVTFHLFNLFFLSLL